MQLKSILNRVQKHKSFVYEEVVWGEDGERASLRVSIRPRAHTRPVCSGCKRARPGYDTLPVRSFEFVPLWGIAVFFVCALRRVNCKRCGVRVEAVPWATGKHTLTTAYMQFLALWARRLAWSEVARDLSHLVGKGLSLGGVDGAVGFGASPTDPDSVAGDR